MATTLTSILLHITFSTKDRIAVIPVSIETDLFAYIGGIFRHMDSPLLAMNGTTDHVHMLVSLGKTTAPSELLLNIKRDSSKWLKAQDVSLRRFAWQEGYFAFSIGESGVKSLRKYISSQKEHHKSVDFKDEMRLFCANTASNGTTDMCGNDYEPYEQPFGLRNANESLTGGVVAKPPPRPGY